MTENKRFTIDNESDIIEFDYVTNEYIQDFIWADGKSWDNICNRLNELFDENKELKKELSEYKDFVFSDDKILCYTCLFCIHKGIYEVDCDVKGHVDVHSTCHSDSNSPVKIIA